MYAGPMKSVSDIIELWGKTADFADAVGVKWMTAHMWGERNRIPPEHWPALLKAAKARGLPVTVDILVEMTAAQKRAVSRSAKRQSRQKRQRHQRARAEMAA